MGQSGGRWAGSPRGWGKCARDVAGSGGEPAERAGKSRGFGPGTRRALAKIAIAGRYRDVAGSKGDEDDGDRRGEAGGIGGELEGARRAQRVPGRRPGRIGPVPGDLPDDAALGPRPDRDRDV